MSSKLPLSSNLTRRNFGILLPVACLLALAFFVSNVYQSPLPDTIASIQLPDEPSQKIEDKTFTFNPPDASIQYNVIRGDGITWTADNQTEWRSVGRAPMRPGCWTYEDRYSAYKRPSEKMMDTISNNNKEGNKKAILLRLGGNQVWRGQFHLFVRSLVMEAGYLARYDVIIYVHLDIENPKEKADWLEHIPKELRPLVQVFSTQDLRTWIPKQATFKSVYEQNHIPIQMFMTNNPKYDFVYSIENDVRLVGRWDHFLADVDAEYAFHREQQGADQDMPEIPDLVSFQVIRIPRPEWPWFQNEDSCLKRFGGRQNTRSSLGVVWGWSRRLTDAMTQYNTEGINCYFEYFAPSVAYQQNLTTFFYQHPIYCPAKSGPQRHSLASADLGKNDPRLGQHDNVATGCSYFFVDVHAKPFWENWYRNPEICRPQALVHPVKSKEFN